MVSKKYPKEFYHYEYYLKRKCFQQLKLNVWENKMKWQLMMKAEYHYRLKLLSMCFNAMLNNVKRNYRKQNNMVLAAEHYERTLKKKSLLGLLYYVESSWASVKKMRKSIEFRIKKRAWMRWRLYIEFGYKIKKIHTLADSVYYEKFVTRYIQIWYSRLSSKREIEDKCWEVQEDFKQRLIQKVFFSWRCYVHKKNCKREILKISCVRYEMKMKRKIFIALKRFSSIKKSKRLHFARVKNFHENFLLQIYINQWLTIYEELNEIKILDRVKLANSHFRRKLLLKTFEYLKIRVAKKRRKEMVTNKVELFREKSIKFIYINRWLNIFQEYKYYKVLKDRALEWNRETIQRIYLMKMLERTFQKRKLNEEMDDADFIYNKMILDKVFRYWKLAVSLRTGKKIKMANAESHHQKKLKEKFFGIWKNFVVNLYKKKTSLEYYKTKLLIKVLRGIKCLKDKRRTQSEKIGFLQTKLNDKIKRSAFNILKNEVIINKSKYCTAGDFWRKNVLCKRFSLWKQFVEMNKTQNFKLERCKQAIRNLIIRKTLFTWFERYKEKMAYLRKLKAAKAKQDQYLIRKFFRGWVELVRRKRKVVEMCSKFDECYKFIIVKQYLISMENIYHFKRRFDSKYRLALKMEKRQTVRKFFRRWISFVKWKRGIIQKNVKLYTIPEKFTIQPDLNIFLAYERKKPMIPSYMSERTSQECSGVKLPQFEKFNTTYRVSDPVNNMLPVVENQET